MEIREKQEPRDLEDTLKSARLLVVPSIVTENKDRDGIPNIMLEAIALGIPIVASAVGGITEVIQNEKYGWLVNPGDPRHLYHCLLRSFAAAEEAAERAESAKRLVSESFSPTSTARAYDSLFKSCL
jgi:glycosyltransferase involved in cell wall biosynthesis